MRDEGNYVRIPGSKTHELPPLLVHSASGAVSGILDSAASIVETEDIFPLVEDRDEVERRKYDLAVQLAEQYRALICRWQWGDSILEWIRQCEITFESEETLRSLLHPDVWPHAGRCSFVTLLADKAVADPQVPLERAVGLRLTFRQPPPIDCFSNQFLFYLNSSVADSAYQTWSHLSACAPAHLPPERFHFQVLDLDRE